MKLSLDAHSEKTMWMLLPTFAFVYDSEIVSLDLGIYFLKYSLNVNIKL